LGSQQLTFTGPKDAMRDGWYYTEGEKPIGPKGLNLAIRLQVGQPGQPAAGRREKSSKAE